MRSFTGYICFCISILSTAVCTAGQWTSVSTLAKGNDFIVAPSVSVDAEGNAVVVWEDIELKGMYSSTYDSSLQQWDKVVRISEKNEFGRSSIQMDGFGNAIAAWNGDRVQVALYDALTKSWSSSESLTGCEKCYKPSISVDVKGNAVLVWYNEDIKKIQSVSYDVITKAWTPVVSPIPSSSRLWFSSKEYDYDLEPKVVLNDQGKGIAIWIQKDGNKGRVQAACYNSNTQEWTVPFNVSQDFTLHEVNEKKHGYDFDVAINEESDVFIVWGEPNHISHLIKLSKYNIDTSSWVFEDRFLGVGIVPSICVNQSGNSALGALYRGSAVVRLVDVQRGVLKNENLENIFITNGLSFFYDFGMDETGSIIVAWNGTRSRGGRGGRVKISLK